MRLALAIRKLRPYGGQERDCIAFARVFAARGHAVRLVTETPPDDGLLPAGVAVEVIHGAGWANHSRQAHFDAAIGRRKRQDGEVLIGFGNIGAADYIFAAGTPVADRTLRWKLSLPRYRSLLALEKAAFGAGARPLIFFLNTRQAEAYATRYGTERQRSCVLPPLLGTDAAPPAEFYAGREETRERLGIAPDATVLLHVAVNPILKGLDRAIDALTVLPESVLVSAGSDSRAMRLRAQIRGVDSGVRFLGYRTDVARLIAASDLLVHPARQEAAGLLITESLLNGVPVVASAACGYAEHVARSGAGALLPEPFDPAALAAALQVALSPAQLPALKERARAYAAELARTSGHEHAATAMLEMIARQAPTL